jgi:hypothetical protein
MKSIWTAGLLALTVAVAGACGNDSGLNVSNATRVRVVNGAPDVATIRVQVGGQTFDNVAYTKATDYKSIDAGDQELAVQTVVGGQTIYDKTQAFTAGADYTLLIGGSGDNITPVPFTDDNARPASGQAKFRVIEAAPNTPTVDIYLTSPNSDIANTAATFTSLAAGNATAFASLPAGSYAVRVTLAGSKTVLLDAGTLTLNDGDIQTAIVFSAPGGGAPYSATIVTSSATS